MSRPEGNFTKNVSARVSPELKERMQAFIEENDDFETEADFMREALWYYLEKDIERPTPIEIDEAAVSQMIAADEQTVDTLRRLNEATLARLHQINETAIIELAEMNQRTLAEIRAMNHAAQGRVEWTVKSLVILLALVGAKILNALRHEKIKPAELVDEALAETVYNRAILEYKLEKSRRAALKSEDTRPE